MMNRIKTFFTRAWEKIKVFFGRTKEQAVALLKKVSDFANDFWKRFNAPEKAAVNDMKNIAVLAVFVIAGLLAYLAVTPVISALLLAVLCVLPFALLFGYLRKEPEGPVKTVDATGERIHPDAQPA